MIQENMLVKVTSLFAEGLGIVRHISDFSFSPIQVELFEPDEHGHKFIRFYHSEVEPVEHLQPIECLYPEEADSTQVEPKKEVELDPEQVKPVRYYDQSDPVLYGLKIVEEEPEEDPIIIDENPPIDKFVRMVKRCAGYSFKVGDIFKASGTGSKYDTCYRLYDVESGKPRGCMLKEFFELTDAPEPAEIAPEIVPDPIEVIAPEEDLDAEITAKVERRVAKLKEVFAKKKAKQTRDVLELKGQVTLFDIMEV